MRYLILEIHNFLEKMIKLICKMPKLFTNCELQMNNSNPSKYQESDVVYKILLLDWGHLYIIKIKRRGLRTEPLGKSQFVSASPE